MDRFYARYGKRALDLALTIPALVLLTPLLLLIALVVRITLGVPVLFRQVRPGLHGKPFMLYKFRTMTEARDAGFERSDYYVVRFGYSTISVWG